jgi:hypothetical protein
MGGDDDVVKVETLSWDVVKYSGALNAQSVQKLPDHKLPVSTLAQTFDAPSCSNNYPCKQCGRDQREDRE